MAGAWQRLCFADIQLIDDNTLEIVADEYVELSSAMLDEYFDFLRAHLQPPRLILANKRHAYTYTFEAQRRLVENEEIFATAVVVYTPMQSATTQALSKMTPHVEWNMRLFEQRDAALAWLHQQRDRYPQSA